MGENKDLKLPDMNIIEEEMNEEIDEGAKADENLDSFIVSQAYFGENEDEKLADPGIAPVSESLSPFESSGFLAGDNENVNSTMAEIVQDLNSGGKGKLAGKPTKVTDINKVMAGQNYAVIKSKKPEASIEKEDSMAWHGLSKGTKAWSDWWKKKRSNCEDFLMAAESGNLEQVKKLLDKDVHREFVANITFQGLDEFTALHFAAQENRYDICKFLIDNGADLEAKSSIGRTPLHLWSLRGNDQIVQLLVDCGASLNWQDSDKYTPLHYACEMGNVEWAKILVESGAETSLRNNLGSRPSDIWMNIDVRNVIGKYDGGNDLNSYDSGSKRDTFHTVILHNDRKSYVQRLMGQFQKVDRYLKDKVNGNEEALIQNIEAQQKQKEDDKKKEKGFISDGADSDKPKKKKKEGIFEKNKEKFVKIVQFEKKIKQEQDSFAMEQDVIGPALFNPIGRLGRGSFGEVYLVEKLPEGLLYAMKILHKRKIMGQNLVRYARTERDVLSYFSHPFIVSIQYAFQTPEKKLYMILEYWPGGDLGSVLKREKKLTEERARLYLTEIILALEELHKKDIIFRDLKPDNVVLDEEGHALLTDFGLSKEGVNNNTSAKSFWGSVAYLAPEVLRRQGHGKSVDWYLVGVLFYEMVVGIPPYFSSNKDQMFKNIKSGPLRMPERLSKDAKDFIIKLLNKNPAKRLGAGKKDSEELKSHSFFSGVNWENVLQRKQKMPKPVIREVKRSTVNLSDIVYGEYSWVGRVASSKEVDFQKAVQERGYTVNSNQDAEDLDRNKIPGWSFVGSMD